MRVLLVLAAAMAVPAALAQVPPPCTSNQQCVDSVASNSFEFKGALCSNGDSLFCDTTNCPSVSNCVDRPDDLELLKCRICSIDPCDLTADPECVQCPAGTPGFCPELCTTGEDCQAALVAAGVPDEILEQACILGVSVTCNPTDCPSDGSGPGCSPPFFLDVYGCQTCVFERTADACSFTEDSIEECPICPAGTKSFCEGGGGNDPHIWGFEGQSYYWDGGDSSRFHALLHDSELSINARATPRYAFDSLSYSDMVSLGVATHSEGRTPHNVAVFGAKDACATAPGAFCELPAHGVGVLVDGKPLRNGLHVVDEGLTVAIMNMPHLCKVDADRSDRSRGMFDGAGGEVRPPKSTSRRRRRLSLDQNGGNGLRGGRGFLDNAAASFGDFVKLLGDRKHPQRPKAQWSVEDWVASGPITGAPSLENDWTNECAAWLEGRDLYEPRLDGLLTTVMIKTPAATLRIEHWGFDVDEEAAERAAAGSEPLMLNLHLGGWRPTTSAHGVLGQTVRRTQPGQPQMEGRGEDYQVDSPFATTFKFYPEGEE